MAPFSPDKNLAEVVEEAFKHLDLRAPIHVQTHPPRFSSSLPLYFGQNAVFWHSKPLAVGIAGIMAVLREGELGKTGAKWSSGPPRLMSLLVGSH